MLQLEKFLEDNDYSVEDAKRLKVCYTKLEEARWELAVALATIPRDHLDHLYELSKSLEGMISKLKAVSKSLDPSLRESAEIEDFKDEVSKRSIIDFKPAKDGKSLHFYGFFREGKEIDLVEEDLENLKRLGYTVDADIQKTTEHTFNDDLCPTREDVDGYSVDVLLKK